MLVYLILTVVLYGCSNSRLSFRKLRDSNDNSIVAKKYSLQDFEYDMYLIEYNDLVFLEKEKYSGIVLFSREDCPYCKDSLDNIVNTINKNKSRLKINEILILETDTLPNETKSKISESYGFFLVPTLTVLENGVFKETHIGILAEELVLKILKGENQ